MRAALVAGTIRVECDHAVVLVDPHSGHRPSGREVGQAGDLAWNEPTVRRSALFHRWNNSAAGASARPSTRPERTAWPGPQHQWLVDDSTLRRHSSQPQVAEAGDEHRHDGECDECDPDRQSDPAQGPPLDRDRPAFGGEFTEPLEQFSTVLSKRASEADGNVTPRDAANASASSSSVYRSSARL